MNMHQCCHGSAAAGNGERSMVEKENGINSGRRRSLSFSKWIVPGVVLAILPKCPLCLAAYVAIGTGLSLSINTAAWIRWIVIILCVASFLYLATSSAVKILRRTN